MTVTEKEPTPLEQALELHLRNQGQSSVVLISICKQAVALGQLAAHGDIQLLDQKTYLPWGEEITIAQIIEKFHLNSFIDWGGGDLTDLFY